MLRYIGYINLLCKFLGDIVIFVLFVIVFWGVLWSLYKFNFYVLFGVFMILFVIFYWLVKLDVDCEN